MLATKKAQKRVIAKIDVPQDDGTTKAYYFNIPRSSTKFAAQMMNAASGGVSEQMASLRLSSQTLEAITPATDRGTTISFVNFLETVVPDADPQLIDDIVSLAGKSDVELELRDDCELVD